MIRFFILFAASLQVALVSGCSSGADAVVDDHINSMNALADAIENGENESKINDLMARMTETMKKLKVLELPHDEMKDLVSRKIDAFNKAKQRMVAAVLKRGANGFGKMPDFGTSDFKMPGFGGDMKVPDFGK